VLWAELVRTYRKPRNYQSCTKRRPLSFCAVFIPLDSLTPEIARLFMGEVLL
jgi:hypothetical protein